MQWHTSHCTVIFSNSIICRITPTLRSVITTDSSYPTPSRSTLLSVTHAKTSLEIALLDARRRKYNESGTQKMLTCYFQTLSRRPCLSAFRTFCIVINSTFNRRSAISCAALYTKEFLNSDLNSLPPDRINMKICVTNNAIKRPSYFKKALQQSQIYCSSGLCYARNCKHSRRRF